MTSGVTDAIMAVIIITFLFILIIAIFGTKNGGGALIATVRGFKEWYEASRISM